MIDKNSKINYNSTLKNEKLIEILKNNQINVNIYEVKPKSVFDRYLYLSISHGTQAKERRISLGYHGTYTKAKELIINDYLKILNVIVNAIDIKIWAKITKGKYKGSIGYLESYYNGIRIVLFNPKTKQKVYLRNRSLEFLPDYDGSGEYHSTIKEKISLDLIKNQIEKNDIVVFTYEGKMQFGEYQDYNVDTDELIISIPKGVLNVKYNQSSKLYNVSKSNDKKLRNKLLLDSLKL